MVQIKLGEIWKATHITNYPTVCRTVTKDANNIQTRAGTSRKQMEPGYKPFSIKTFLNDAAGLWNSAPVDITNCDSLELAKARIKSFVKKFPVLKLFT